MRKTFLIVMVLLLVATTSQAQSLNASRSWLWPIAHILDRITTLEAEQAAINTRLDNLDIAVADLEQRLSDLEAVQNQTNVVGLTLLSMANDVSSLLNLQRQEYGARATLFPIGKTAYYADGTSFVWEASHRAEMIAKEQEKALRISKVDSIAAQFNIKLATLSQAELTALQNTMETVGTQLADSIDDLIAP